MLASKKLTITTYSVVAHYYAVLVSVLRATAALSGDVASIERASIAQKGLLHAVRHVIAHCESSSPLWRDQWPIFVAAAESEDMIHADWLLMKLGNNRYSMLQKKISLQKGR